MTVETLREYRNNTIANLRRMASNDVNRASYLAYARMLQNAMKLRGELNG